MVEWCKFLVGLNDEDQNKIKKEIKRNKNGFRILLLLIIYLLFFKTNTEPNLVITSIAIVYSFLFTIFIRIWKLEDDLRDSVSDNKIRKEEREIKLIEDSIYLFYIPLQNLLTIHDENVIDNTKQRLIHEIKGHKHLAKFVTRSLFETYLQGNDESKKVSKERLSDMVSRDLENLHKRFMELNEQ